ncbi:purine-binding chemotaxis protein CheW [Candidatus Bathyarchaeota archaeon]|nr:purine-binding chemotaxis protein CheW [Candidatus Bathyarchaeota archaeon]
MASDSKQVVLFSLNGVLYGADVNQVREIREVRDITPVPYAPVYIEGVTNLRGEVIPVINLRKRFGIEEVKEKEEKNKIMIVVQGKDKKVVGVVVDSVMEVAAIPQDNIERAPEIISTAESECVLGVAKHGENLIVLLDLEKAISRRAIEKTETKEASSLEEQPMQGIQLEIPT